MYLIRPSLERISSDATNLLRHFDLFFVVVAGLSVAEVDLLDWRRSKDNSAGVGGHGQVGESHHVGDEDEERGIHDVVDVFVILNVENQGMG